MRGFSVAGGRESFFSEDLIFIVLFKGNASFLLSLRFDLFCTLNYIVCMVFQKFHLSVVENSRSKLIFLTFFINVFVFLLIIFINITYHILWWNLGGKRKLQFRSFILTRMLFVQVSICCLLNFSLIKKSIYYWR